MPDLNRRQLLAAAGSLVLPLPRWASAALTNDDAPVELDIGAAQVRFDGRAATATGINGTVPGPLLRWREGDTARIRVRNSLEETSSIHWHGLLLPTDMDGVPGLSFDGIAPGGYYDYEVKLRQNGTYWYHSHSGLQEQTGVYGPLIIDPAGDDPVGYDREFVVLLSDWTFEDPWAVMRNLKHADDYYNRQRRTARDFIRDARERGFGEAAAAEAMWAEMRMHRSDIADVSGATYTYLMNGRDTAAGWSGEFKPGERVRLRFINAGAMSFFNVRIPGVPMTVVQADGQPVDPVEVDEFQIATAETYDVIVTPADGAYTIMAESMDRSGYVAGTLTSQPGRVAAVPALRPPPKLTMADMGMQHHGGGHPAHHTMQTVQHDHPRGPNVANVVDTPLARLDHPGIGLEDVGHRVLCYADLRSREANDDPREPGRRLELHLTGNMHRYLWSFDGRRYDEVRAPIEFAYGERLRLVFVNDTMMAHPIHLHGVFVELVNGNGRFNPQKHTVTVKPAERLAVDVTADEPGLWAFHCHLLYHMKAGMMRAVRIAAPAT